jgi:hypothetical protein
MGNQCTNATIYGGEKKQSPNHINHLVPTMILGKMENFGP